MWVRARAVEPAARGRDPDHGDRLDPNRWSLIAENLAAGQWRAEQVVAGWLGSPTHRSNLLIADTTHGGTAVLVGGRCRTHFVQLYGRVRVPDQKHRSGRD